MIKFYLDPKFYTALVDALVSLALFFAGKYGLPDLLENMKFVIVTIQPIFAMILVGMFQAQQEAARMGNIPSFMARK